MIGSIVTYTGEPPTTLGAPDVAKVVELFMQQNEILKNALTSVVIVPAGSKLEAVRTGHNEDPSKVR